ncbi:helix-turn-helix domain-containing protein [Metabacillus sp. Hm71]|uniref:helix-turn-helix domain-containing protein n=1 Tax=Metabacillus sp. Hm71 TaxID=3450743 RepID=UPI003F438AF8
MKSLHEYQMFETVAAMDAAAAAHIEYYRNELTETDRTVLRTLLGYSCKVPGVSYLKMATLAEIIGISDRQVRRIIKKMADLKIIEKIQTIRSKSGGYGVNILRVLPFCAEGVRSTCHIEDDGANTIQTSDHGAAGQQKTIISKSKKKHILETEPGAGSIGSDIFAGSVPAAIHEALASFFNASDYYRIYGILLRAKASIDRSITLEDHAQEYVQMFRSAIWRLKTGRIRSLDGYLFRSWQSVSCWIQRKQAQKPCWMYDWIND